MATARTRAARKYNEKAYDRIELKVPKGDKDKIKAFIGDQSLNAFINEAIQEKMNPKPAPAPTPEVSTKTKQKQLSKSGNQSIINYTRKMLMEDWQNYRRYSGEEVSEDIAQEVEEALIRNLFPGDKDTAAVGTKTQYICPFTGKKFGSMDNLVRSAIPWLIKSCEAELAYEKAKEERRQYRLEMEQRNQRLKDEGKFPKY